MSLWTHTVWEITLVWLTASHTVCSSGYLLDRLCSPFFLSVSLSLSLRLWIFFLCEKYCFYPPDIALLLKFRFHPVPCQRDGGEDVLFFAHQLWGYQSVKSAVRVASPWLKELLTHLKTISFVMVSAESFTASKMVCKCCFTRRFHPSWRRGNTCGGEPVKSTNKSIHSHPHSSTQTNLRFLLLLGVNSGPQ